jgi:transcriptional regulator with XRE-family HTH domain
MSTSALLILETRRRAGLAQAELGARVGKAASAIGRWERGEVEPSFETLRQIIRAAGFELAVSLYPADDHDLALIRRGLRRSPPERMADLVTAVRALDAMSAGRG